MAAKQKEESKRKMEAVLRLLKGETLDAVSRDLGVTAAKLSEWMAITLKLDHKTHVDCS